MSDAIKTCETGHTYFDGKCVRCPALLFELYRKVSICMNEWKRVTFEGKDYLVEVNGSYAMALKLCYTAGPFNQPRERFVNLRSDRGEKFIAAFGLKRP